MARYPTESLLPVPAPNGAGTSAAIMLTTKLYVFMIIPSNYLWFLTILTGNVVTNIHFRRTNVLAAQQFNSHILLT